MKKLFFSFVMLVTLVIVAGSAIAQTNLAPIEGMNFTYTVNGLNTVPANGDDVYFYVTLASANDPLTVGAAIANSGTPGTGVWYAASGSESYMDNVLASLSINITWGSTSGGNSYRLWVVVKDGTSNCYNYRFIPVNPMDNTFDIGIFAVGIGDNSLTGGLDLANTTANGSNGCISLDKRYDIDYDASNQPTSDGNGYAYYRVKLVGPASTAFSWKFTPAFTNMTDATWEYSVDLTSWVSYTIGATTVPQADADQTVYLRAKMPLLSTSRAIDASISAQQLGTFINTLVPDILNTNDGASFTVDPIPAIGTFSGN